MSIEIGDNVVYENIVTINEDGIPTVNIEVLKVKGIEIEDGNFFVDSNDIIRDKYRVRYIFRKGEDDKIDHEGYDERRIAGETNEMLERFKREKIIKNET